MRYLVAVILSTCAVWLYSSAAYSQQPAHAERVSITHNLSENAGSPKKMERAIARSAEHEHWWMWFVGVTLVGYRLIRQHQVVFESSFLS